MSQISCCGVNCESCEISTNCPGCTKVSGKVFWTEYVNAPVCPIYHCCATEKRLSHCGYCEKLPCENFGKYKNPTISEDEQKLGLEKALKNLKESIK